MNNELDVEEFVNEGNRILEEFKRVGELVKAYKKSTPKVTPIWDTTSNSIQ